MMERNINNYLLIYLIRLIIFTIFCFSKFINCETCGGDPPNINTPNFGDSICRFSVVKNEWVSCDITTDSGNNKTYFSFDSNGKCLFTKYCKFYKNKMVVRGTNECIDSCATIHDSLKGKFVEYGAYCIYSDTSLYNGYSPQFYVLF